MSLLTHRFVNISKKLTTNTQLRQVFANPGSFLVLSLSADRLLEIGIKKFTPEDFEELISSLYDDKWKVSQQERDDVAESIQLSQIDLLSDPDCMNFAELLEFVQCGVTDKVKRRAQGTLDMNQAYQISDAIDKLTADDDSAPTKGRVSCTRRGICG